jgi:hypothetical protein
MAWVQTGVTAVVSHRDWVDGLEGVAQAPDDWKAEEAYLKATAQASDEQRAEARRRVLEWLPYHKHRLTYRKRTEMAIEIVRPLEASGQFPQAPYAFDKAGLTLELRRLMERCGKHWVSEFSTLAISCCRGELVQQGIPFVRG